MHDSVESGAWPGALQRALEQDVVARVTEPAVAMPLGADRDQLTALFALDRGLRHVVLVDDDDRPLALVARDSHSAGRPAAGPLIVDAGDSLRDVVLRALARPEGRRLEPVACCDARGGLIGLVRIERAIEAALGLNERRAADDRRPLGPGDDAA